MVAVGHFISDTPHRKDAKYCFFHYNKLLYKIF